MNCIIVHGSNLSEKEAKEGLPENERHWKPWLKKELEKRGIKVSNELYPKDWMPNYNDWKKIFERNNINEETVLIGHSAGSAFVLRWLSENKIKVNKVILIAPYITKGGKYSYLNKFNDFEFDSSLKRYFDRFVIFYAEDDDEDIIKNAKQIHKKLGGKLINFKGKGHFIFEHMGTKEFPELLKEIIS